MSLTGAGSAGDLRAHHTNKTKRALGLMHTCEKSTRRACRKGLKGLAVGYETPGSAKARLTVSSGEGRDRGRWGAASLPWPVSLLADQQLVPESALFPHSAPSPPTSLFLLSRTPRGATATSPPARRGRPGQARLGQAALAQPRLYLAAQAVDGGTCNMQPLFTHTQAACMWWHVRSLHYSAVRPDGAHPLFSCLLRVGTFHGVISSLYGPGMKRARMARGLAALLACQPLACVWRARAFTAGRQRTELAWLAPSAPSQQQQSPPALFPRLVTQATRTQTAGQIMPRRTATACAQLCVARRCNVVAGGGFTLVGPPSHFVCVIQRAEGRPTYADSRAAAKTFLAGMCSSSVARQQSNNPPNRTRMRHR